jgi:hypothetical protein
LRGWCRKVGSDSTFIHIPSEAPADPKSRV